ncbi:MAG: LytTR family DNA-binding domain-containing protein [Bacilli bacterium]|nr:LytTR family DNA-binding domain-containing protein [Bacilli bacterium]
MRRYSIAIVEDEEIHAKTLSGFLFDFAKEEGIELTINHFESSVEAAETFKGQYDILFLDIMMAGMTGMELAKEIRKADPKVMIIFVTSLAQFAVEGYEVEATDYILKPLNYAEFSLKMHRAFSKLPSGDQTVLHFTSQSGFIVVPVEDIYYCETSGHSVIYHAANGDYRKHQPMKDAEKEMAPFGFLRINSCYLVAKKEIIGIKNHFVVLRNGERLLISRPRLSDVIATLKAEGKDEAA